MTQDTCELCAAITAPVKNRSRCTGCLERGDLVGDVVWDLVRQAVREAGSADRVTFMLAGLPAVFLEGITRAAPGNIAGRSLLVRMNPSAARNLRIDPALQSVESAVHWRHNANADVILFAPSDTEREGIGAGLGPLARIDGQTIVDQTEKWLEILGEKDEAQKYLYAMLEGLKTSQIFIDVEMWVDFVRAIKEQQFAYPPDVRVQNAAPALRIPRDGITKLPMYKPSGNSRAHPKEFALAFQLARAEVAVYAGLMTPKQEPVDTTKVQQAIDAYLHNHDKDVLAALRATKALLDDEANIRPGDWRESQRVFCERVSWERVGAALFSSGSSTVRKSLGKQTLEYIEGNYGDEVTREDRALLETLKDANPKEPKDEELEFFSRWQERLNHPNVIKLFKGWQKRLFSKEVIGHDLVSAFSDGFEALTIAGADALAEMRAPCVLVRTTHHNKALFWEKLDVEVQRLFRFELRSVRCLFGSRVRWDLDACFKYDAIEPASSTDARKIDLELYLIDGSEVADLSGLKTPPKAAPRVKATWQPGLKPKNEPISLAFPRDIEALATAARNEASLFRRQVFAPRTSGDDTRIGATTLGDTNSFNDVAQAQEGRTFDLAVRPNDDVLTELRRIVADLATSRILEEAAAHALTNAVDIFGERFREAILAIDRNLEQGFAGDVIPAQADAFGSLCHACRLYATTERARAEIRPLVAQIGILFSDGADPMAILAAWHPLRLAERRAKILELAAVVDAVLSSQAAREADLAIAFEERRALGTRWFFPEAAIVGGTTMISVEDVAGYSLLVPAGCVARSQEALETSAPCAAAQFMEGVDQYLEVYPNEATSLSLGIYDSESLTLPREIARLVIQRIHRDPDLRCDLVITHHEQGRLTSIYRNQNMQLAAENISETAQGFLSRLRVDVRPNRVAEAPEDAVRDLDLVFLHDTVSQHARPIWDLEQGSAESLDQSFDLSAARRPRRRLTEVGAPGVGIYLTLPRPPRAVAQYHDLLYEMEKAAVLPDNFHGVLIRHVQFDGPRVRELISSAHRLAEWVVSYDKVMSRQLLEQCNIKIIRDISLPGLQGRVIVSAGKIDARLKENLREDLIRSCGIDGDSAVELADVVLDDVAQVSGQKLLSAARYANSSREIIGLSLMRAHLEASLLAVVSETQRPIWISLDEYRRWFTSGKGKIADVLGVTVLDVDDGFELLIQVGEAKFVGMANEVAETLEARKQVRDTVERLAEIFIDNKDRISHKAWCTRLTDLLVNRDGLSDRLHDTQRRAAFVDKLSRGEVRFRICGEAMICLHDDHGTTPTLEYDSEYPHLRHHILPTPIIRQTLQTIRKHGLPNHDRLRDIRWYGSKSGSPADSGSPTPGKRRDEAAYQLVNEDRLPGKTGLEMATAGEPRQSSASHEKPPPMPRTDRMSDEADAVVGADLPQPRLVPPPVYELLSDIAAQEREAIDDPSSRAWAERICMDTQRALSHFNMQAHFTDQKYRLTPNGALITFRGHGSLTVDKIEKKTGELLTTHGIEIIDIRPGRGTVSLFVKRDKRAKVPLATIWLRAVWPDRDPGEMTTFVIGAREDDDHLLYLNLAGEFAGYEEHGPHTLIAGETGSGKGVLTQGFLLQLIAFNHPAKAELVLIDPKKGVDFGWLNGAPHMKRPIVTDVDEAKRVFDDLVTEMDARYELLAREGAPNIHHYNQKVCPERQMSRIFLVHDELGAWMAQEKDYQDIVLSAVANLGMKARAAGIHLLLITQRADADAVPTRLRDNMGNRLCLKVQNSTGSRMVLGIGGAEKLLGKGHLACVLANQPPPPGQDHFVVQVPFAETGNVSRLAEQAMAYWRTRMA